jgi:hypothetical protein
VGRAALIATVLTLTACEHGVELVGQVAVPVTVQRMFSAERPGELIVRAKVPEKTYERAVFAELLCAPSDAEKVFQVRRFWFACAVPEVVTVSAVVVPRQSSELACGAVNPGLWQAPEFDPQAVVASGTASAPVVVEWGFGCKDGSASFALRLLPLADQISAGPPAR